MRITDFLKNVNELDFDFEIDGSQVRIYQKTETMKYLVATVNTKIDYCYSINQVVCPKKINSFRVMNEQTTKLIEELALKLGTTAEYL